MPDTEAGAQPNSNAALFCHPLSRTEASSLARKLPPQRIRTHMHAAAVAPQSNQNPGNPKQQPCKSCKPQYALAGRPATAPPQQSALTGTSSSLWASDTHLPLRNPSKERKRRAASNAAWRQQTSKAPACPQWLQCKLMQRPHAESHPPTLIRHPHRHQSTTLQPDQPRKNPHTTLPPAKGRPGSPSHRASPTTPLSPPGKLQQASPLLPLLPG
jgi:hypothetical protein